MRAVSTAAIVAGAPAPAQLWLCKGRVLSSKSKKASIARLQRQVDIAAMLAVDPKTHAYDTYVCILRSVTNIFVSLIHHFNCRWHINTKIMMQLGIRKRQHVLAFLCGCTLGVS